MDTECILPVGSIHSRSVISVLPRVALLEDVFLVLPAYGLLEDGY